MCTFSQERTKLSCCSVRNPSSTTQIYWKFFANECHGRQRDPPCRVQTNDKARPVPLCHGGLGHAFVKSVDGGATEMAMNGVAREEHSTPFSRFSVGMGLLRCVLSSALVSECTPGHGYATCAFRTDVI